MKLAAIYNVWDGEELLEASLRQVRPHVQHVVALWQDVSNWGEAYSPEPTITTLVSAGLIDEAVYYEPAMLTSATGYAAKWPGHWNETEKRNLGITTARAAGCTHFLSMDCDEFYDPAQFAAAKEAIKAGGYDASACQMRTYYRSPRYQLTPPECYYVPFIHALGDATVCGVARGVNDYPVTCDPTRGVSPHRHLKLFRRDELEMHHMSFVRRDIARKLRNHSSAKQLCESLESDLCGFESYRPGAMLHPLFSAHNIIEVPDRFGIGDVSKEAPRGTA